MDKSAGSPSAETLSSRNASVLHAEGMTRYEIARRTYFYDILRSPFSGVGQVIGMVVLLAVIRGFDTENLSEAALTTFKALVPAANFLGLFLSPLGLAFCMRTSWRASGAAAFFIMAAGLMLLVSAFAWSLPMFVFIFILSAILFEQNANLVSKIYASNYSPNERGHRMSMSVLIIGVSLMLTSLLAGELLDRNFEWFRWVIVMVSFTTIISACFIYRIPSKSFSLGQKVIPFSGLRYIFKDRIFGLMMLSTNLLGIAFLPAMAVRIEYLANPAYGINATNLQISLATLVIPSITQLLTVRSVGKLFDKMHYTHWRILLSTLMLVSFLIYFNTKNLLWIYTSSALFGVTLGGLNINWMLWITRVTSIARVPAYMSAHIFLTGIRGFLGPFLGFFILSAMGVGALSWLIAIATILSSIVCIPTLKSKRLASKK